MSYVKVTQLMIGYVNI